MMKYKYWVVIILLLLIVISLYFYINRDKKISEPNAKKNCFSEMVKRRPSERDMWSNEAQKELDACMQQKGFDKY